jgi:hypothetical protein
MSDWFRQHDITSMVVDADLLERPLMEHHEDEWEWRVGVAGKTIPIRRPIQVEWRRVP